MTNSKHTRDNLNYDNEMKANGQYTGSIVEHAQLNQMKFLTILYPTCGMNLIHSTARYTDGGCFRSSSNARTMSESRAVTYTTRITVMMRSNETRIRLSNLPWESRVRFVTIKSNGATMIGMVVMINDMMCQIIRSSLVGYA